MKKSELRNIIKEELLKEMSIAKHYILVSKQKDSAATIDDFKKIIAKLQGELKKYPGAFNKYHAEYAANNKNYEVELILNPDKINKDQVTTIANKVKAAPFVIEPFGF